MPATVHYEVGKKLRWVASVSNVPAADCLDKWEGLGSETDEGRKIKRAMSKIQKLLDDDGQQRIMYGDYTDKDTRWVFAYPVATAHLDTELEFTKDKFIEVFNGKNKLGFINWAISSGTSDPLLYSLHKGGIWENQNFLDTIKDSVVIRRGFFPLFKHKSVSGKPLDVDYSGVDASIELNAADGEEAEVLVPPPLDAGISQLAGENNQRAASATGLNSLRNLQVGGRVQFAALQAEINIAKQVLDPYIRNFEKAAVDIARLALI